MTTEEKSEINPESSVKIGGVPFSEKDDEDVKESEHVTKTDANVNSDLTKDEKNEIKENTTADEEKFDVSASPSMSSLLYSTVSNISKKTSSVAKNSSKSLNMSSMWKGVSSYFGSEIGVENSQDNSIKTVKTKNEKKNYSASQSDDLSDDDGNYITENEGETVGDLNEEQILEKVNNKQETDASEFYANPALNKLAMLGNSTLTILKEAATDANELIDSVIHSPPLWPSIQKEYEKLFSSKQHADQLEETKPIYPWSNYKKSEELKSKILFLSSERKSFIRGAPPGVEYEFDITKAAPQAVALLDIDENLEKMRFKLVPKLVKEEEFWTNYFYRVSLLQRGYEEELGTTSSADETAGSKSQQKSENLSNKKIINKEEGGVVASAPQNPSSDVTISDEKERGEDAVKAETNEGQGKGTIRNLEDELEAELDATDFEDIVSDVKEGKDDVIVIDDEELELLK